MYTLMKDTKRHRGKAYQRQTHLDYYIIISSIWKREATIPRRTNLMVAEE